MLDQALRLIWTVFDQWELILSRTFWILVWLALGLLLLRISRREVFERVWPRIKEALVPVGSWAGAFLVFLMCFTLLGRLEQVVSHRVQSAVNNQVARNAEPEGSSIIQYAPKVTYLNEKKYLRTLMVPPTLLERVRLEGVQALAPYLTDPTSENITALVDRFKRNGAEVIFTREATLNTEEVLRLDRSRVNVDLNFISARQGARNSYYNADFKAQYAFSNPLDRPVTARFKFPMPDTRSTLSNYQIVVDGQELPATALSDAKGWEGVIKPGQSVNVQVTYRSQGRGAWAYALQDRRDPIRDFELSVRTNIPQVQFAKGSMYPTKNVRTLSGTNVAWELKNVLNAQNIQLLFARETLDGTLSDVYTFAPFALQLALIVGVIWALWRRLRINPVQVALGLIGLMIGTFLGGMLMTYLPMYAAGLIGAAVGLGLAVLALGRAFWFPATIGALLPLAFLSDTHAGLVIALTAVVVVAVIAKTQPQVDLWFKPWQRVEKREKAEVEASGAG